MGKAIRESSVRTRLGTVTNLGVLFRFSRKKGLFWSVYVDDIET